MKYLLILLFLQLLLLRSFPQEILSNDDVEKKDIEIQANKGDWCSTGIKVKKNDLVFLNVYGTISLGLFAGEVNGTGNKDNPFLVAYSRDKDVPHGALICSNDDEVIFAHYKQDLQNDNPLFDCVSQLFSSGNDNYIGNLFTDEFIGNFFQPKSDNEELKLLINDADYSNNYGSLNVSIIIYHNFFPEVGDVIIYWGGTDWILHSGYVTAIDPNKTWVVTEISSFIILPNNAPLTLDPDDIILTDPKKFGSDWAIYHTNRPNGRLIEVRGIPGFSAGYTDKGTTIWFSFRAIENCHGYTFAFPDNTIFSYDHYLDHYITGYRCIGGKLNDNDDKDHNDQGMGVEYILTDNGYHQVHAQGINSHSDHFKKEYEVQNFHLRK